MKLTKDEIVRSDDADSLEPFRQRIRVDVTREKYTWTLHQLESIHRVNMEEIRAEKTRRQANSRGSPRDPFHACQTAAARKPDKHSRLYPRGSWHTQQCPVTNTMIVLTFWLHERSSPGACRNSLR